MQPVTLCVVQWAGGIVDTYLQSGWCFLLIIDRLHRAPPALFRPWMSIINATQL